MTCGTDTPGWGGAVNWQDYVTVNPTIAHGKACFKGTGILVSLVLDNLATGQTVSDILASYSSLTEEAVRAAVVYAVEAGTAPERPGRASSSIQKVCTIVGMREHQSDAAYWRAQPYQARLAQLEIIRQEFHRWKYRAEPRLQRVHSIVKR